MIQNLLYVLNPRKRSKTSELFRFLFERCLVDDVVDRAVSVSDIMEHFEGTQYAFSSRESVRAVMSRLRKTFPIVEVPEAKTGASLAWTLDLEKLKEMVGVVELKQG